MVTKSLGISCGAITSSDATTPRSVSQNHYAESVSALDLPWFGADAKSNETGSRGGTLHQPASIATNTVFDSTLIPILRKRHQPSQHFVAPWLTFVRVRVVTSTTRQTLQLANPAERYARAA